MIPPGVGLFLNEILNGVLRVLSVVLGVQSIVQSIEGNTVKSAQETTPFYIQDSVKATQGDVESTTWGLFAIKSLIDANQTALLAAIGTPMQAGATIPLPPTPPPGYGGPPSGDTASAVWQYIQPGDTFGSGQRLFMAGSFANNMGALIAAPVFDNSYMTLIYDYANGNEPLPPTTSPDFDLTQLLPSDTVGTWLNRIDTQGNFWTEDANGFWEAGNNIIGYGYWRCTISAAELAEIKQQLGMTPATISAPLWPGLAGVVLGAAVPISTGLTINGPMSGVIVAITSTPSKNGYFQFDTDISWRNIGAITFQSDNGQDELPQTLGFTSAVYCPKAMTSAAKCLLRSVGGVNGTVTPWTAA